MTLARKELLDIANMTTNVLALAGASGPLPAHLSELVFDRLQQRDLGIHDFLEIFNHRLISLLSHVYWAHRFVLLSRTPDASHITNCLYSFVGLGFHGSRNRTGGSNRSLVQYSGLLFQQPRSASALERMLSDHFCVPINIQQFSSCCRQIEPDEWTYLGQSRSNQALGRTATAGTRVFDQQARFNIVIGPLSARQFIEFLPEGNAYRPLCQMARFYAPLEIEFHVRLRIQAAEMPEFRLGQSNLGWTTFLKSPRGRHHSIVDVSLGSPPPYREGLQ